MTSTTTSTPPGGAAAAPAATVHLTLVLDRSGSMEKIRGDVIGGINQLVADQQAEPGNCKFTMVTFDTQGYDYVHMATDMAQVLPLTEADFVPRSGTNLYDAIGRAITELDVRVGAIKTPEIQLFAIFTDGEENSSRNYSREQVFTMIEEHQAKGWTFTYLGANQNAYEEAAAMGIRRGSTQAYAGDGAGAQAVYASFSSNVSGMRANTAGGQSVAEDFFVYAGKGAEADFVARNPEEAAAQGVTVEVDDTPPTAE
jgi:uncharacterized protein YegL